MPCQTVVMFGDSEELNAITFRQMSGRAGRRGFDKRGNVVFAAISQQKVRHLHTHTHTHTQAYAQEDLAPIRC
jgi:superfamily II RNA helicase